MFTTRLIHHHPQSQHHLDQRRAHGGRHRTDRGGLVERAAVLWDRRPEDFVNCASFAEGARSLVHLPSVALVRSGDESLLASLIVADFPSGTPVAEEHALALADIAHPEFRDRLRAEVAKTG